jgi:P2 family phage major capsid protein
VTEIKGQKVFIGVSGPVTGRTNTKTTDREAKDASSLDQDTYELSSTESDVGLPYAKIDAWAKFPDFHQRYSAAVQKQIALDRIMVGFHGPCCRADRHRKYPMLQDVNKGWLQQAREQIPAQVLKEGKVAGKVTLGAGGDYANLDALVHDTKQLVDERLRDAGDLIAIIGTDLLAADKAKLYSKQGDTPTEKERIEEAQVIATAACRALACRSSRSTPWWSPVGTTCRSTSRTPAGASRPSTTQSAPASRTTTAATKVM